MRILLLDIETAPNIAHVWGLWKQNIAINQIQASGYVLCWAAKWLDSDEVMFDSLHAHSNKRMLARIHKLLDQADAVVHYNGTNFDIPTLNKEFIKAGMTPPSPYRQIDLFLVAKKKFRFPSNKLEFIARELGVGGKVKHEGHELWIKCMADDDSAWGRMEAYNRGDVTLLQLVYDKMLPWIDNHPNAGGYLEAGIPVCPNCGSSHLQARGYARTQVNKYRRYQCMGCFTWSRSAMTEFDKDVRANLLRPALG